MSVTWSNSSSSSTNATSGFYFSPSVTIPTTHTLQVTYYDPLEDRLKVEEPAEYKSKKKKVKKTTVDPLDWLNQRVAEIAELVEL